MKKTRRFRAVESCIDEGCRCDDRAGVVLYDGPDVRKALQAEERVRPGYSFLVEEFISEEVGWTLATRRAITRRVARG